MEKYPFNKMLIPDYLEYEEQLNFLFHINDFDYPIQHSHLDYWEFTIITKGNLEDHVNGRMKKYATNTLFFNTPKDVHCLVNPTAEKSRYINLLVKESYLTKLLACISPSFQNQLLNGPRSYTLPQELIVKIKDTLHKLSLLPSQQFKPFYNDSLCSVFLLLLQHIFDSRIEFLPEISEKESQWLQKLKTVMKAHNSQTYTVNDLCEKLNYSRMQLNRLFNLYLKSSPHQYLIDYKLSYAKNLLRNSDLKLVDIAMATGYATLAQFNTNFKKKMGLTPKEYRNLGKKINTP